MASAVVQHSGAAKQPCTPFNIAPRRVAIVSIGMITRPPDKSWSCTALTTQLQGITCSTFLATKLSAGRSACFLAKHKNSAMRPRHTQLMRCRFASSAALMPPGRPVRRIKRRRNDMDCETSSGGTPIACHDISTQMYVTVRRTVCTINCGTVCIQRRSRSVYATVPTCLPATHAHN
jgi:hypothetical protein